jgi:Dolichyl-phosphate-mannose-protein mannosyltransferase
MRLNMPSTRRLEVFASGGVALLAVLVRLPNVYSQPFWQDEVASARILRAPNIAAMLARVAHTESTPPFWYCLAWVLHAVGVPIQDVRLLSVASGGLLAGFTVLLAHRLMPLPFAAAVGALVALGGEYVARGQELRAYELFALLSVLFALCLIAELSAPSRTRELRLAAVVAIGGLTHYFFAFTVLAALAWLQLDPRARAVSRRASLAIIGGGVIAAAWAPVALQQYQRDRFSWIGSFQLRYVLAVPLRLFTPAYNDTSLGLLLSSLAAAAVVVGGIKLLRASPEGGLVVSLALVPLACAALVWSTGVHVFALRNLIAVGPFAAIAVADAARRLPRLTALAITTCLCVGLAVSLELSTANTFPHFDAIARSLVRDGWRPSDPIAVFGSPATYRSPLEWYLPHQPSLVTARASGPECVDVFVVSPNGRVRFLRSLDRGGRDRGLPGATILVDPAYRSACPLLLNGARNHTRRITNPGPAVSKSI